VPSHSDADDYYDDAPKRDDETDSNDNTPSPPNTPSEPHEPSHTDADDFYDDFAVREDDSPNADDALKRTGDDDNEFEDDNGDGVGVDDKDQNSGDDHYDDFAMREDDANNIDDALSLIDDELVCSETLFQTCKQLNQHQYTLPTFDDYLNCVEKEISSLQTKCYQLLTVITASTLSYCGPDITGYCISEVSNPIEVLKCLNDHHDEVSQVCTDHLQSIAEDSVPCGEETKQYCPPESAFQDVVDCLIDLKDYGDAPISQTCSDMIVGYESCIGKSNDEDDHTEAKHRRLDESSKLKRIESAASAFDYDRNLRGKHDAISNIIQKPMTKSRPCWIPVESSGDDDDKSGGSDGSNGSGNEGDGTGQHSGDSSYDDNVHEPDSSDNRRPPPGRTVQRIVGKFNLTVHHFNRMIIFIVSYCHFAVNASCHYINGCCLS
jgi:hypothetical protein